MAWPDDVLTAKWLLQTRKAYLEVECGEWSYGRPRVHCAPADIPRKLTIGRYCSFAEGVEIFVGRYGRHPLDTLSTYPIGMAVSSALVGNDEPRRAHPEMFSPSRAHTVANLNVEIGNDVWIGLQAMILAGCSIGTGAVIGARAVVTSDVPPYAIAVGVPAKVLKFRHEPELIEKLLESEWWTLNPDDLWTRCGTLLTSRNVSGVLSLLRRNTADVT